MKSVRIISEKTPGGTAIALLFTFCLLFITHLSDAQAEFHQYFSRDTATIGDQLSIDFVVKIPSNTKVVEIEYLHPYFQALPGQSSQDSLFYRTPSSLMIEYLPSSNWPDTLSLPELSSDFSKEQKSELLAILNANSYKETPRWKTSSNSDNEKILSARLKFIPLQPGIYSLSPAIISLDENGKISLQKASLSAPESSRVPKGKVVVLEPVLDKKWIEQDSFELATIHSIIREPVFLRDFIEYLLIYLVIIILVTALLIYIIRKQALPVPEEMPEPEIPPHQIALARLKRLKEGESLKKGQFKFFYAYLTHIFREYLEKQFQINALEMTSREILRSLRTASIPALNITEISALFRLSDAIKYAKARPSLGAPLKDFQTIEAFVLNSRPLETDARDSEADLELKPLTYRRPAPFSDRLMAFIIDASLNLLFWILLATAFFLLQSRNFELWALTDSWIFVLGYFVFIWLFQPLMSLTLKETPGKRLFHLEIVDLNGSNIHFGQFFGRHVAKLFSLLLLGPFSVLFILLIPQNRALHDIPAKTVLLKKSFSNIEELEEPIFSEH